MDPGNPLGSVPNIFHDIWVTVRRQDSSHQKVRLGDLLFTILFVVLFLAPTGALGVKILSVCLSVCLSVRDIPQISLSKGENQRET